MDYEAKDWELNPHLYLQDKDGNFVRKKDGTPRKKGGRPPKDCLLYTSPSPRDGLLSRMPSSA